MDQAAQTQYPCNLFPRSFALSMVFSLSLSLQAQLAKPQPNQTNESVPGCPADNKPDSLAAQPAQAPSVSIAVQAVQANCKIQAPEAKLAQPPDEGKAEQWAREHLAEWLDTPCPFVKAKGRTWRQLAENQGDKIMVNGRPCSARAYLHALEGWHACKVWQRMKARVALEVGKNGNHLAAISG